MKHVTPFSCKRNKQRLLSLLATALAVTGWTTPATAQIFTVDSLTYEIFEIDEWNGTESVPAKKAFIKEVHPDLVHAAIPETVDYVGTDYPVHGLYYNNRNLKIGSPFYNHTALRSVTIPANMASLSDYAFGGCTNLNAVTFAPESHIILFGPVFYGCTSLTSLDFPSHATFSGSQNPGERFGILYGSGVKHIRLSGDPYPYGSTTSGPGLFEGSPELESVVLAEGVTTVPEKCFRSCPKLASVTFPESLVKVGSSAFGSPNYASTACPFLLNQPDGLIYTGKVAYAYKGDIAPGTVLDIRPGTRSISYELLYREKELAETTIRIPKSVEYIDGAITQNMEFEEGNPTYPYVDGILYGDGGTALIKVRNLTATDFTIPSTVNTIYGGAFEECNTLRSLTIPATVQGTTRTLLINNNYKDLGGIVQKCNALERVTIQSGAVVSSRMFTDCPALKDVTIDCNYVADTLHGYLEEAYKPFQNCPAIETLTFTDRVDYIAPLFSPTTSSAIRTLNLPERVKWIGNSAFSNFTQLKQVAVPYDTYIHGKELFAGCTNLEQVDLSRISYISSGMFRNCTSLTTVELSDITTQLGDNAFAGCTSLATINLPARLTYLGNMAFYGCTSLATINLDNVKQIGTMCFMGCTALNEVHAPAFQPSFNNEGLHPMEGSGYSRTGGVYYLGTTACGYDISLPDSVPVPIDIREGTTDILPLAFSNLSDLTTNDILPARNKKVFQYPIHIANSVRNIGPGAFKTPRRLTGYMADLFNLPVNVEYIGEEAFSSFTLSDTLFILPASVKYVGNKAFNFNISRDTLRFYVQTAEPCEIYPRLSASGNDGSFTMSSMAIRRKLPILYVPAGSKEAYEESPWAAIFPTIREYDRLPTAIHAPTADTKETVRLTPEGICVSGAARAYTFDGQLVAETREATTLKLPKGRHYIVVCGRTSVKVYVP